MKPARLILFFLSTILVLSACAPKSAAACESTDAFTRALRSAGAQVEVAEQLQQGFFTVPAQRLVINGDDVQVWEYTNESASQADAAQISDGGYAIGSTMVDWIATPHFFQCAKLIVLYLGENEETLTLLENILGEQIAAK